MTTANNKPAAIVTAKGKISKAQHARNVGAKLAARAKSEAEKVTLEKARENVVRKTGDATSAARVYAHALIAKFGADYYTFTAANSRTDNEKAHYAAIETERKACAEAYAAKYGEAGKNMPWSRAKQIARQLREGGNPREGKPLDQRQKATLLTLYKAGMKEERQTETEAECNAEIGRLLVRFFKVDISQF